MNFIYFIYFCFKTDYKTLNKALKCAISKSGKSKAQLIIDMFYSSINYGSSFVDYFNFQFYLKNNKERKAYATMGFMYQFHKNLNNSEFINLLDNKEQFSQYFKDYCNTPYVLPNNSLGYETLKKEFLNNYGNKYVFKDPLSTAGCGIAIEKVTMTEGNSVLIGEDNFESFINKFYKNSEIIYVEKYLQQHSLINEISPSALNTIRIITVLNNEKRVDFIGAIFRISVNSHLDNFSQGNLAAEIDIKSGKVITGGIKKNSSCDKYHDYHPVTKKQIKGFQIPHWKNILSTVESAALIIPEVKTIGWDVAVLQDKVLLIEGNSKWNKDTWQIPAGYGKKEILEKHI